MRKLRGQKRIVFDVAYGQHGRELAALDSGGEACVYDLATFDVVRRVPAVAGTPLASMFARNGPAFLRTLGLLADGDEWPAGSWPRPFDRIGGSLLAHSPDGQTHLARSAGSFNDLMLIDRAGRRRAVLQRPVNDLVWVAGFAADGEAVGVLTAAGAVRLFRTADGTAAGERSHPAAVTDFEFAPGGVLAVASGAEVIRWQRGEPLARPCGTRAVSCVAFSPDGRLLAAGGEDWCVRLWDAASGAEVLALDLGCGPVHSVAFSPDGSTVAAACGHGFTVVFDADV